eukprot:8370648-Alexandrium_andersonii.AAC.1
MASYRCRSSPERRRPSCARVKSSGSSAGAPSFRTHSRSASCVQRPRSISLMNTAPVTLAERAQTPSN